MTEKKPRKTTKNKKSSSRSWWRRLLRVVLIVLTVIASVGLIAASYGGYLSPAEYRGISVVVMLFPIWAMLMVAVTVADALWCRRALLICVLTYIVCGTALWEFSPLNVFTPDADDYPADRKFKVISYNCCHLSDRNNLYPDGKNLSVSFLLRENADIVCLQELTGIHARDGKIRIAPKQIDSLHRAYPYIYLNGHSQMLLSKYPAKVVPTKHRSAGGEIAVFQLDVEGLPITLINVHLQSYGLTQDDKHYYREITELNGREETIKGDLLNIKSQLLSKIQRAAERRAGDAERIGEYIRRFGGPNVLLMGDFNDVPGCYTLRRMAEFDMRQVYEEVGFGPMITYYDNRFYFRIDHILYRGNLKPLDMERSDHDSSDHSPLIATFAITTE